ncbi:MAG: 2-amino-4-hydroxy-6-hydroxymethyldihydropteridine diphosphokinase, partial [Acidobacteria bacterium]|nr:2-amino-4-hydroxy-6-hydroxymethyldihydropteridine diphosphokinase [Acidobacteriota bacterium]
MNTVYLSLGSNLGDRAGHLEWAVAELRLGGVGVKRVSSIHETEPVGFRAQPWFLNTVVEAETALFPIQLLDRI